jgi:hypothetical protein
MFRFFVGSGTGRGIGPDGCHGHAYTSIRIAQRFRGNVPKGVSESGLRTSRAQSAVFLVHARVSGRRLGCEHYVNSPGVSL